MEGKLDVCGLSNRHKAKRTNLPRISPQLAYAVLLVWLKQPSGFFFSLLSLLSKCVSLIKGIIVYTNHIVWHKEHSDPILRIRVGDMNVFITDWNQWAPLFRLIQCQSILLFFRVPPTHRQQLSICISSMPVRQNWLSLFLCADRPAQGK